MTQTIHLTERERRLPKWVQDELVQLRQSLRTAESKVRNDGTSKHLTNLAELGSGDRPIVAIQEGLAALAHAVLALSEVTEAGHDKVAAQVQEGLEGVSWHIADAADRHQFNLDFPLIRTAS